MLNTVLLSSGLPVLDDIAIILGISVIVVLIFHRLKIPTVVGYLAAGTVIGPHALSLVDQVKEVEALSEVGVILLLFVIGLEYSLPQFRAIKKIVLKGGGLQVGLTIAATALIYLLIGEKISEGIFAGFLLALSSTAIVLKLLQDNNEVHSPHGKTSLAILIFQDIMVVPMMLLTPLLAGKSETGSESLLWLFVKGAAVIGFVLFGARHLIPKLLRIVVKTRNKELFLITVVVLCVGVAWLTSLAGLSLALGAFLAGLIISESEFGHEATANVTPFRELFACVFFVSIGMLLDFSFLSDHLFEIILLTLSVATLKFLMIVIAVRSLKLPSRTVMLTGLSLFQIGEFAFILSKSGLKYGLMDPDTYQYFLSASLLTMVMTPFVLRYAENAYRKFSGLAGLDKKHAQDKSEVKKKYFNDHIVIIGFGVNGRNVAVAAREVNIPYAIIELNADTVKKEKLKGEPIYYGDAIHPQILEQVDIEKARVVVVAITDPAATRQSIQRIRQINPGAVLIARTRFVKDSAPLIEMGADEVVPEEFETSIEVFTRVLRKYNVNNRVITRLASRFRKGVYTGEEQPAGIEDVTEDKTA